MIMLSVSQTESHINRFHSVRNSELCLKKQPWAYQASWFKTPQCFNNAKSGYQPKGCSAKARTQWFFNHNEYIQPCYEIGREWSGSKAGWCAVPKGEQPIVIYLFVLMTKCLLECFPRARSANGRRCFPSAHRNCCGCLAVRNTFSLLQNRVPWVQVLLPLPVK